MQKFNVGDIVRWYEQEEIKTETRYDFTYGVVIRVVTENNYESYGVKWFRDDVGTNVDYDPRFLVRAQ
jgi:hypothetical protein